MTAADNTPAIGFCEARGWEALAEADLGAAVPRTVFAERLAPVSPS